MVHFSRMQVTHVLQEAPLGEVIERVADGDERHLRALGELGEAAEPARLVGTIAMHRRQIGSRRRGMQEPGQPFGEAPVRPRRRHGDEDLALCGGEDFVEAEQALALLGAPVAGR